MERIVRRVNALNSLVFIQDSKHWVVPDIDGEGAFWATDTCVALSCLPDCDGKTEIVLSERDDPPANLIFLTEVKLTIPSRKLAIELVPHRRIAEADIKSTSTMLAIWTDGHQATEKIFIKVR